MALIRCNKAGSSQPTETTLWTNATPTADYAGGNVTLSSDIDNFDFIRFVFKKAKNASETATTYFDAPVSDVKTYASGVSQSTLEFQGCICVDDGDSRNIRAIKYVDDTTLAFSNCIRVANASNVPNLATPVSIIGIKY